MTRRAWCIALAALASSRQSRSADWTTWGGPRRNFTADDTPLLETWPATGPREIWRRPLGEGYSGIAAAGDTLYTMHHRAQPYWLVFSEQQEVVVALDAATGATRWECAYAEPFRAAYSEIGPGPYAMPQVVGDRLFSAGAAGKLKAFQRADGKLLWERDLYEELGGTRLEYGYSSHAMPYGDNLLVLAGGEKQALACIAQATGETRWAKLGFKNAHSTPILIEVDGQQQLIALTASLIFGADPKTGELLWSRSHDTDYGLAIAMPVWSPRHNLLVYSAAYNFGAEALRLRREGAKTIVQPVWREKRLQVHFGNMVLTDDALYLTRGHSGPAFFTGVDLETGRVLWETREIGKASLLPLSDGRLVALAENGELCLASVSREGLKIQAKKKILEPSTWTPPTLINGRLYARNRSEAVAIELSKQ